MLYDIYTACCTADCAPRAARRVPRAAVDYTPGRDLPYHYYCYYHQYQYVYAYMCIYIYIHIYLLLFISSVD